MSPGRVLIVRTGAMGDVLHALPAVAALRAAEPGAEIVWAVEPRWAPLLIDAAGHGPVVSRIVLAETRAWSAAPCSRSTLRSILALRTQLRTGPFDAVIDMQGTLRSAVIARMARGPGVTGYNDPRERAAALLYGTRAHRKGAHVVEQGAFLLGHALGRTLTPLTPALPGIATPDATYPPTALLAPAAGWGAKQWPAGHYAQLAQALHARGWTVRINSSGAGDNIAQGVVEASRGTATAVTGDVAALLTHIRRAAVVVAGDSGPLHLAAALGRPVVALFGPTDPARNGPWGPGPKRTLRHPSSSTSYRHSPEPDPGLSRISPGEVLAAVVELTRPPLCENGT